MDFVKGDRAWRKVQVFSGRFGALDVQNHSLIGDCFVHILS